MRKIVLLLTAIIITNGVFAQDYTKAIGLRIGSSIGASYKQFMLPSQAIEGILDLDILDSDKMKIKVTGIYQFYFDVDIDGLSLFAGPGASAGIYVGDSSGFLMAIDGMAGVEYKFRNAPIALSFDWNPKVQIITNAGFKPDNFGLTIRYTL
ncbi:MAG: hypothetical protein WCR61_02020 [Bacteroidales bacterium]